ncbi:MAG: hypothetical protein ABIT96_13400 [Ferruginibacter sp.]
METLYKAYSKNVLNKKYYFVKKIYHFPEYNQVDDILEGYGMHENFFKACSIAGINDVKVRKYLLAEAEPVILPAKVVHIFRPAKYNPGIFRNFLQTMKWALGQNKATG